MKDLTENYERDVIIKLADDISFRLLGTRSHADYGWLVDKLQDLSNDVIDNHIMQLPEWKNKTYKPNE